MEEIKHLEPTSMDSVSAKLFTHLDKVITKRYESAGRDLLLQALKDFGLKDMEILAYNATVEGTQHTIYDYIPLHIEEPLRHQNENVYQRFTRFFAAISKRFVDSYGEEGANIIRAGVRNFGVERGAYIAQRVRATGKAPAFERYLDEYDFGRSDLFEIETTYHKNDIEQVFTACPLAKAWAEDGVGEYGILYCDTVDQAVAYGYNSGLDCIHDKYALKDGYCHFLFCWGSQEKDG